MRTVSALSFAGVLAIPGMLLGLMVWYLIGQPSGTWNPGVVFACNLIPLGSIIGGQRSNDHEKTEHRKERHQEAIDDFLCAADCLFHLQNPALPSTFDDGIAS